MERADCHAKLPEENCRRQATVFPNFPENKNAGSDLVRGQDSGMRGIRFLLAGKRSDQAACSCD